MGIFDLFKKAAPSEDDQDIAKIIILKKIEMTFQELTSKADALNKLGRFSESEQKYAEAINGVQSIVDKAPGDYLYKLAFGEHVINLGYMVDKKYFSHAEIIFNRIVKQHSEDKNADLTQTYWRLGLIQERLYSNTVNAIKYYKLAMQSPKGNLMDSKQKDYDLSAVYLSMANILSDTDIDASISYAKKRLNIVNDCPQAKAILTIRAEQPDVKFYLSDEDEQPDINWHIVQELVKTPIVLNGQDKSLTVTSTDDYIGIWYLLIHAKSSGWHGGDIFFHFYDSKEGKAGVANALEPGMKMVGNEAAQFARIVRDTAPAALENHTIRTIIEFCESGGFVVASMD